MKKNGGRFLAKGKDQKKLYLCYRISYIQIFGMILYVASVTVAKSQL